MAKLNLDYYDANEDQMYSDGSIENEMYERISSGDETLELDVRWAVFYHFSRLRENILNWYPFKEGCSILEVGAGCGALTGLFVRKGKHVVSCELTMNRARIIYERYKAVPNLEIYVGDIDRMHFDIQFDYIIVNGVLEYAKGIMGDDGGNPYKSFLEKLKRHLKLSGHVLLAIENRLGLKYLAGAPEDHCGKIYEGINGYPVTSYARTFSKQELDDLCAEAGFAINKWYYPYPDYKFPAEIFTDESINVIEPSSVDVPYDMPRAQIFNNDDMYHTLMKEKVGDKFANSFLVDLGLENANALGEQDTKSYIKISNNRNKCYALYTAIDPKRRIAIKVPLYSEGRKHISAMLSNVENIGRLHCLKMQGDGSGVYGNLVVAKTLRQVLELFVVQQDVNSFWNTLNVMKEELINVSQPCKENNRQPFEKMFGDTTNLQMLHWMDKGNIDLNADNIFIEGNQWTVIDNEWVFPFPLPVEFILWRLLRNLRDYSQFETLLSEKNMCAFLGVTAVELTAFVNWERQFAYGYVGMRDLSALQQPIYVLDINKILSEVKNRQVLTSHLFVFLDSDSDSEPLVLEANAKRETDRWKVRFEADALTNAKYLRWDPLEGNACEVWDIQVSNGLTLKAINAAVIDDKIRFDTFDPQFVVTGDWSTHNYIDISFQCKIVDWSTGYRHLEEKVAKFQHEESKLQERIARLQQEKTELQEKVQSLSVAEEQLNSLKSARGIQKIKEVSKILSNK